MVYATLMFSMILNYCLCKHLEILKLFQLIDLFECFHLFYLLYPVVSCFDQEHIQIAIVHIFMFAVINLQVVIIILNTAPNFQATYQLLL
jgi:hypothetical protein